MPPAPEAAAVDLDAALARLVAWYEALSPHTLDALPAVYDPAVRFKDPFNEVQGHVALRRVFEHMFRTLDAPRFHVDERLRQGRQACLTWRFTLRRGGGQPLEIRGATHLRLGADGRVTEHRDYWDAAEELYAKLPLLGALMRALQRRLRAT